MTTILRRTLAAVLLPGVILLAAGCYKVPGEFLLASEAESIPYAGGPVTMPTGLTVTLSRSGKGNDYTFIAVSKDGQETAGSARFRRIKGSFYVAQVIGDNGPTMFLLSITQNEMKLVRFKDDSVVKDAAGKLGLIYNSENNISGASYSSEAAFSGSVIDMRKFVRTLSKFEYAEEQ